jgi:hypothetical protein
MDDVSKTNISSRRRLNHSVYKSKIYTWIMKNRKKRNQIQHDKSI